MNELREPKYEDYLTEDGNVNMDTWLKALDEYQKEFRIYKFEKAVKSEMGITDEDWSKTPDSVKASMVDMYNEAERHAEQMYELEDWIQSAPI
jgi:hypothetical protein